MMKLDDVKHFFECMQTYQKHTKKTRFTVDILPKTVEEMIRVIDEAKTVEPKRGKWEYNRGFAISETSVYTGRYKCDQCGHYIDMGKDKNYCPNCGAKME